MKVPRGCGAGHADSVLQGGRGWEVCWTGGRSLRRAGEEGAEVLERDDDLHWCAANISLRLRWERSWSCRRSRRRYPIKVLEGDERQGVQAAGGAFLIWNSSGKGDLIVIRVQTLSLNKQKELLEAVERYDSRGNTPTSRGLFEKVKEMFS